MNWIVAPSKFEAEITEDYKTVQAWVALSIHGRLIQKTPVDTGRAESNWWPSIGTGSGKVSSTTSPGESQADAMGKFNPDSMPDWPTLYITNNLDYIEKLNSGSSIQAPAQFVELAVQEVMGVF